MAEQEEEAVVVGQMPTVMVPRHVKKRSLKNKALSISFNEKDLRDYVTGFHKRKKKRRKEAQRQIQEKERLKRIEARKKRKQEREIALYGRLLSKDTENEGGGGGEEEEEEEIENEPDLPASISETKTYEDSSTTVTVTTSEISRENNDLEPKHFLLKPDNTKDNKNHNLAVSKKPLKKVSKKRVQKKGKKGALLKKRDKRKNKGRKK